MNQPDKIEFYNGSECIAHVESSMVPPKDSLISIKKETWRVVAITYSLDYSEDRRGKLMCANIALSRAR